MGKYVEKPVAPRVVEAYRLQLDSEIDVDRFAAWAVEHRFNAWGLDMDEGLLVYTKRGSMRAAPGDWIVKDSDGNFSPWTHENFEKTFKPAE